MGEVTDPAILARLNGAQPAPRSGPPAFIPGTPKPAPQPTPFQITGEARDEENQGIKRSQNSFNNTMDLRSKFDAQPGVKTYRVALPQYVQGLKTADNTPQGDLALIYAFAKVMDPDSVVREGEAAAVASSDTLAGKTVARLTKELGVGGTFSTTARNNLRREMQTKVAELNRSYNSQRHRYVSDAKKFGLDPVAILGEHDGKMFMPDITDYWKRNPGTNPRMSGGKPAKTQPSSGWGAVEVVK